MIRSMTGFGREQRIIDEKEITVEIRSVNHRYNEITVKAPRQYGYLESNLKALAGGKISRGKGDISVTIRNLSGKEIKVIVNQEVVESCINSIRSLPRELSLADNLNLSDVFRVPDAFTVIKDEVDEDVIWDAVRQTADSALKKFIEMREVEGAKMKSDIIEKLVFIENATAQIEELSPQTVTKYREKLLKKMNEVIANDADEQRILLEAAIFAEKSAVDEETVRLKSHIAQIRELLETEDVVGRKSDFIVQEMNREINTIGSKSHDIDITRIVVDIKSELEKIREQIQNIE